MSKVLEKPKLVKILKIIEKVKLKNRTVTEKDTARIAALLAEPL